MNPLRHAPTAVRVLLGLTFFVFGLNGFLHFLPQPPMPAGGGPGGRVATAQNSYRFCGTTISRSPCPMSV